MSPKDTPLRGNGIDAPDRTLSMSPSPFGAFDDTSNADDNNADPSSAAAYSTDEETPPFKISLWLLPPDDSGIGNEDENSNAPSSSSSIRSQLQGNIDDIAKLTGGPTFVPHVTILGGIPCLCRTEEEADHWAAVLLEELQSSLPSVGGIPCRFGRENGRRPHCVFEDGEIANANDEEGEGSPPSSLRGSITSNDRPSVDVKWNQSCVSTMDRCPQLGRAVELTYRAVCRVDERLGGCTVPQTTLQEEDEVEFDWTTTLKPPLCEPHYSHAYGNKPDLISAKRKVLIGEEDGDDKYLTEVPPDFVSEEALLIWTWPAKLEGVPTWREVGRVRLS